MSEHSSAEELSRFMSQSPLLTACETHSCPNLKYTFCLLASTNTNRDAMEKGDKTVKYRAYKGVSMLSSHSYNATTHTWMSVAPLQQPRAYVAVAVLHGRVYAIGGNDEFNHPTDTVEIYDPATDCWHFGPRIQASRCDGKH